jgi:hypothetical protein
MDIQFGSCTGELIKINVELGLIIIGGRPINFMPPYATLEDKYESATEFRSATGHIFVQQDLIDEPVYVGGMLYPKNPWWYESNGVYFDYMFNIVNGIKINLGASDGYLFDAPFIINNNPEELSSVLDLGRVKISVTGHCDHSDNYIYRLRLDGVNMALMRVGNNNVFKLISEPNEHNVVVMVPTNTLSV